MSGSAEKECPACRRALPLDNFHADRRRPDGLAFYCRRCALEKQEVSRRVRGISPSRVSSVSVPPGSKWCPDCDRVKSVEEFARTRRRATGLHSYCKPCHNARGKETVKRLHGSSRHYHLMRRYGIWADEVAAMVTAQGGVCAVCREAAPGHVDHDHLTGRVRGVLCFNCNGGLGQFRDRIEVLEKAAAYLRGTTWQRVLVRPGVYRMRSPHRVDPRSPSS